MSRIKKLKEERAAKVAEMRSLTDKARDEKRNLSDDEASQFDAAEAEVKKYDAELRRLEALEELDKRSAQDVGHDDDGESSEEMRAFCAYVRGEATREQRAALTTSNSAVIIPKEISQRVISDLAGQFSLLSHIDLRVTDHAKTFVEPLILGDLALERISMGGQQKEGSVTFEGVEIKAHDYRLPVIPVSITLMEGSDIDVQNVIVAKLTEHIARGLTALGIVNGESSNTNSANGITAMLPNWPTVEGTASDSIAYDDLVNLVAKVKAPYGNRDAASFLMNSATRAALMKIADKNGRPIFIESTRDGEPDRLLGRPVVIDDNMPDIAAGAKPIAYGALKNYVMRIVKGVRIRVYDEQAYAKDNCVGIQAFISADGKLLAKTGKIEPIAALELKAE